MDANRAVMWCLAGLGLVGCGRVDGAIPIQDTATAFAQAICPKAYSCCTAQQLMGNAAAGTTEAECELDTTQKFQQQLQVMQASQNAGRANYDAAAVGACLAAIRAASCSDLTAIHSLSQLPACHSTFATPLVAAGGQCQQDYECIPGVCQHPAGSFDGVCVTGLSAGASCATNRCASSLVCDGAGTMETSDDVCVAPYNDPAAAGSQCFYGGGCSTAGGRPELAGLFLFILLGAWRRRRSSYSLPRV